MLDFRLPLNDLVSISLISLKISFCALLIIFPMAMAIGSLLAHNKGPLLSICETLLLLPMVLPPSSCGLLLLTILSPNGIIGSILWKYFGVNLLLNWKAAVAAAAFVSFPLLMRACQQSFAQIPASLDELAKSFGLTKWQTFTEVTIPLALPGIVNGCILALARSLGEFGSTMMVAGLIPGQTETLALAIYARTISGKDGEAWILASVSLILSFILLLTNRIYLRRKNGLNTL